MQLLCHPRNQLVYITFENQLYIVVSVPRMELPWDNLNSYTTGNASGAVTGRGGYSGQLVGINNRVIK